jgi:4-hydroxymandelate oxidase
MLVNLDDFEQAAAAHLLPMAYDYYRGGARDERCLFRNRQAFSDYQLAYRVLRGFAQTDLTTEVLGHRLSLPVMTAPTAFHQMAHPDGEIASARATCSQGSLFILSTLSNKPMEEVIGQAGGPVFFQLYVYKDRKVTEDLVRRAEAAGARALVVTVDAPVLACREKDRRNRFTLPAGMHLANLTGHGKEQLGEGGLQDYVARQLDPALSWNDIEWLSGLTRLPLVVKGIVHPEDAREAAQRGVRAVVVSNHGGRQLDQAPASLHCVQGIRQALPADVEVWMDGGVRRGGDVLLALALGAKAVLIGRPVLWGLAARGEEGVAQVYQQLREELLEAALLTGCAKCSDLNPDWLERRQS